MANEILLEVKNLRTYFFLDEGTVKSVDGASFDIYRGQTLGVVGESGCGKSVTARSILRIVDPPGRIVGGEILYHRDHQVVDLARLDPRGDLIRSIRGAEIAMVFQEPMTSFSPVHTIGNQIVEAIRLHQPVTPAQAREQAIAMLHRVGMPQPERRIDEYPHQLSGGMRQRAMIAMALSCRPKLLLADEPTTALDVTTQAQILEILTGLQREMGMATVMITHDLGVVAEVAQWVVVMYLGRVVEVADVRSLFHDPRHPYTQALLQSIPKVGRRSRARLQPVRGMVPNPYNRPPGCLFHPRCPLSQPGLCDTVAPELVPLGGGRQVSCLRCGSGGQA